MRVFGIVKGTCIITQVLSVVKLWLDFVAKVSFWDFNIILWSTILSHEVQESIIDVDLTKISSTNTLHGTASDVTYKLVFSSDNIWDVHVVLYKQFVKLSWTYDVYISFLFFLSSSIERSETYGRWAQFFKLLSSEDIDGNKMDLGVTVLSSLGSGHIDDLQYMISKEKPF